MIILLISNLGFSFMNLLYVDTCLGDRLTSKAVPKIVKGKLLDIKSREKVAIN